MLEAIRFVREHWADIAQAIAAFIGTASLIVRLTPTLKDDNFLLPIVRFIGKYIALDKYGPNNRPN